jgi:hypothetical protein
MGGTGLEPVTPSLSSSFGGQQIAANRCKSHGSDTGAWPLLVAFGRVIRTTNPTTSEGAQSAPVTPRRTSTQRSCKRRPRISLGPSGFRRLGSLRHRRGRRLLSRRRRADVQFQRRRKLEKLDPWQGGSHQPSSSPYMPAVLTASWSSWVFRLPHRFSIARRSRSRSCFISKNVSTALRIRRANAGLDKYS